MLTANLASCGAQHAVCQGNSLPGYCEEFLTGIDSVTRSFPSFLSVLMISGVVYLGLVSAAAVYTRLQDGLKEQLAYRFVTSVTDLLRGQPACVCSKCFDAEEVQQRTRRSLCGV